MSWNLRRWAALGPILFSLAAAPGCVNKPAVSIHHAEVRGLSPFGVGVMIVLSVRNDNSYDVQIRNVHAMVMLSGRYSLGPIDISPNQWLPANQTTLVAVPMSIPWTLVPAVVAESAGSYAIPYYVKGYADVTATRTFGINKDNYPVDEGGSIPRDLVMNAARSSIPLPF